MDAAYLTQTVGPTLTQALTSLSQKKHLTKDPVTFVAEFLLHHDATTKALSAERKEMDKIIKLKESVERDIIIKKHQEEERRQAEELKVRAEQEAEAARKLQQQPAAEQQEQPAATEEA